MTRNFPRRMNVPHGPMADTVRDIRERHTEKQERIAKRKRQSDPGSLRHYSAVNPNH